jgi:predicted RNase H-like HicB family nuclease
LGRAVLRGRSTFGKRFRLDAAARADSASVISQGREADMRLEEYLSIPYRLVAYSAPGADGVWRRYAEYPEIGCISEADTPTEAMEKLEEQRVQYIVERVRNGEPIPVPRPPLRSLASVLDLERLGFAKWLVENQRLNET